MIVGGVDASFTRTGITLLDTSKKTIECFRESTDIRDKSFTGTVLAVTDLSAKISKRLSEASMVFLEEPFPNGEYSSGLFALDTVLVNFISLQDKEWKSFNPTTLKHIIGHRAPKKSESVELANKIIQVLVGEGWSVKTDHRMCHDEAESLIYAVYGSLRRQVFEVSVRKKLILLSKAFKEVTNLG